VKGLSRTAAILGAFALGGLLPQAAPYAWLIRWLVMTMLFLVFLQTRLSRSALHRSHFVLLAANLAVGFASWRIGLALGGPEVGLAAFFCGITPTAIAAPVIVSFLGGAVDYAVASFLLTNVTVAALLPLMLPVVLGRATPEAFAQVAGSVGLVVFVPFALAHLLRALHPAAHSWPTRLRNTSFALWVTSIFLITAKTSQFIRENSAGVHGLVAAIAAASLLVCVVSFALGRLIGGRAHPREASQCLGQKNTTFTIYLALAYSSPLVALGPTFYVLWHNLWNSWQLHRAARAAPAACPAAPAEES
jgi:BASS family bile acid:Na+ symporter